ncbi:LemA family protein [Agrobacterium sp. NPDC090283]|uniref:LemA family protein n=1 Tax=Agrobacterium sp. NPDC090283 TaxID=3363920 RepID=UPI00383B7CBB
MATTSDQQSFLEATDIFGRFVRATNFMLDNWWLWVALAIMASLLLWLRSNHAVLGRLDERCSASAADIDALLAERYALIGNLVETVKGFAVQEHSTIKAIVDARSRAMESIGQARLAAETQIGQSLTGLFAASESYPDLLSSTHFRDLRDEIIRIEDRITAARRFYNISVEELNASRRAFPGNIIALIAKINKHDQLVFDDGKRDFVKPVQINFS